MSGYYAEDICNESIDAAGLDFTIGDLQEGTRPAQVVLRHYWQCLRQLHRAAHWDFARATAPLLLLADATGSTPNVGTVVPLSPFQYEYALPIDAMKMRYLPWNYAAQNPGAPSGNIVPPNNSLPLTSGQQQGFMGQPTRPARFLLATDQNYPSPPNTDFDAVQGVSPAGRTVILTNAQNATAVYTRLMLYPQNWDPLFRAAMVAYLASFIAMPLAKDKKFGLELRNSNIAIAKDSVQQARISDGNEGGPSTSDIAVDWLRRRKAGYGRVGGEGWGETSQGILWGGWDGLPLASGAVF